MNLRQRFLRRANFQDCFNASITSKTIGQVNVRAIIAIVRVENSGS